MSTYVTCDLQLGAYEMARDIRVAARSVDGMRAVEVMANVVYELAEMVKDEIAESDE